MPRVGWQVDPFGHSRELASIWAQVGVDALFFARIDARDRYERMETGTLEVFAVLYSKSMISINNHF